MPRRSTYIGIDPGSSSGAIAFISSNGEPLSWCKFVLGQEVVALDAIAAITDASACIEKVGAMPGQGVASTFKFGQAYGFLRGMFIASKIPLTSVTPRGWQKEFVTPKGKTESKTEFKTRLWSASRELFTSLTIPKYAADAFLIAEYIRRKEES